MPIVYLTLTHNNMTYDCNDLMIVFIICAVNNESAFGSRL